MGRLIDEGELVKVLKERATNEAICGYMTAYDVTNSIIDEVNEQPTAYNLDKVVKQLEKEFKKYYGENYNKAPYLIRAIEIVKGEYATEQSCEWKLEDSESNLYVTGCKNRQLIFEGTPEENGYKYCPYCGRKIKRGGADAEH